MGAPRGSIVLFPSAPAGGTKRLKVLRKRPTFNFRIFVRTCRKLASRFAKGKGVSIRALVDPEPDHFTRDRIRPAQFGKKALPSGRFFRKLQLSPNENNPINGALNEPAKARFQMANIS
jgi:hypothetical protein